ncbi:MAG: hypothetical protein ACUVQ8_06015 [Nitrososphaeria archaeon]
MIGVKANMVTPEIGLVVCSIGASNTEHLTGLAAVKVVKRLGREKVGICSLPASFGPKEAEHFTFANF